jgi:transposase
MTIKKNRKTYTAEFKAEALKLAERVGVVEAARQLKIYETQIYNWRNAAEKTPQPASAKLNWPLKSLSYAGNWLIRLRT